MPGALDRRAADGDLALHALLRALCPQDIIRRFSGVLMLYAILRHLELGGSKISLHARPRVNDSLYREKKPPSFTRRKMLDLSCHLLHRPGLAHLLERRKGRLPRIHHIALATILLVRSHWRHTESIQPRRSQTLTGYRNRPTRQPRRRAPFPARSCLAFPDR
jgi:hypothetical protein